MRRVVYDGIAMWNALEANRCYSYTTVYAAGIRTGGRRGTNIKYCKN
jgi:hypothetical protein